MYPATIFAMARISEMNRELSAPALLRRHEANARRTEVRRAHRHELVARTRRVVVTRVIGRRTRTAAIS